MISGPRLGAGRSPDKIDGDGWVELPGDFPCCRAPTPHCVSHGFHVARPYDVAAMSGGWMWTGKGGWKRPAWCPGGDMGFGP